MEQLDFYAIILRKVLCGTEITATQEDIPETIQTVKCYLGWHESLEKFKKIS